LTQPHVQNRGRELTIAKEGLLNTEICLPDHAIRYVLLQRTAYLAIPRTLVYRALSKISPWELTNAVVPIEARFRKRRIRELFNEDIAREYESIRPALPAQSSAILDVGCGIGGIDVLLNRHYADNRPTFYLLDKTQVDNVYYGFKSKGAFYNSLEVAKEVLIANGVASEKIELIQATQDNRIAIAGPIDLVISLISWGFHYPVGTYLERVHELLRPGGQLILDVRSETDGEAAIRAKFASVRQIEVTEKYTRVCAIK
jgi:SAM-dependent methyltransferase